MYLPYRKHSFKNRYMQLLGWTNVSCCKVGILSKYIQPPSYDDEMNSKNAESCNEWTALRRDLSIAAHDAGNPIVSNGPQQSIGRETNNRVFRCGTFHRSSRTSAMELTDIAAQYQCTSLVKDRKNNRLKGRELPKRIKTVDQRGCACRFQFIVKWDNSLRYCLAVPHLV